METCKTQDAVKFDTQSVFKAMGEAVDLLMSAAPAVFEHKPESDFSQGKRKLGKRVA